MQEVTRKQVSLEVQVAELTQFVSNSARNLEAAREQNASLQDQLSVAVT
jgi:hypothetical protein